MKVLIPGGTVFLGRHIVDVAPARGHEVVLLNRGRTNAHLFPEIEWLRSDRDGNLSALRGRRFDAVIDPSGDTPEQVRPVTDVLRGSIAHYTFSSPLAEGDEGYRALKARCEETLGRALPGRTTVRRAAPLLAV